MLLQVGDPQVNYQVSCIIFIESCHHFLTNQGFWTVKGIFVSKNRAFRKTEKLGQKVFFSLQKVAASI